MAINLKMDSCSGTPDQLLLLKKLPDPVLLFVSSEAFSPLMRAYLWPYHPGDANNNNMLWCQALLHLTSQWQGIEVAIRAPRAEP